MTHEHETRFGVLATPEAIEADQRREREERKPEERKPEGGGSRDLS